MDDDPVFYRRFSKILEEAIAAYRERRISEVEYLKRATEVMEAVVTGPATTFRRCCGTGMWRKHSMG
jgi:hypothetical protein